MGHMSTPLSTFQAIFPAFPNQDPLVSQRIILCRDGPKMVRWNSNKYLSTAGISFASLHSSACGKTLVRPTVIVTMLIDLWSSTIISLGSFCHANCNDKSRIDSRMACHFGRNGSSALSTCLLPLTNPFLEALQTEIVPTWCLHPWQ
jgi:hypothetical protein